MTSPGARVTGLRRASLADAARLLAWRNEPESVRWSVTGRVDPAGHVAWLTRQLADVRALLLIGEGGGAGPLGLVRVEPDAQGTLGWVSVIVDPEWRGQRVGWQLLDALEPWMTAAQVRATSIVALRAVIHRDHLISRRLFVSQGYRGQGLAPAGAPWLLYRHQGD